MSWTRTLVLVGLIARAVAQSSSSSEAMLSIQTDPPTPTSSPAPSSSTSSSASDQIGSGIFPTRCADICSPLADTFLNCGLSDFAGFNVTCLCTTSVENTFLDCIECALSAESDPAGALANYQRLMDAYIQQCQTASTTLPNVTVQIPTSSMASDNSQSSSSSMSSSMSTSMPASSTSSLSSSAASAGSSGSSTTSAPSSASSAAASASPSNTATRGVDNAWVWSLTGVGGVVLAAALGV